MDKNLLYQISHEGILYLLARLLRLLAFFKLSNCHRVDEKRNRRRRTNVHPQPL